jgi:hypothetical protein
MPARRAAARESPERLKLRASQTDQKRQEDFRPVAGNFLRSLFGFDSRRAFRVLQFGAQIRLPLYLLLITVAFMSLFAWHTHSAYAKLYAMVMTAVPESFQEQILRQTQDFSIVGAAILGGFVLAMLGFCIAYTHTLLGPTVPLRRQVQSMKGGNYQARNKLRKSDAAHQGLADDLNELASILQHTHKNARSDQGAERSA